MKKSLLRQAFGLLCLLLLVEPVVGQIRFTADTARFKTVSAGPQYKRSGFYQFFWGSNHRKEWTQPVLLPVLQLDTLRGGLLSYKEGGSNQSKSLQLTLKGDKEYALRSVDKTLDKVIPALFQGTFVTDIVNDAISMSNPYGALGVPGMAKAIGINHTKPEYFYLPHQAALDTLNMKYAGKVYLLEQRPKGDWSEADNLGNFSKFEDLEDFMKDVLKSHKYSVDQKEFARARMLDILINDFDRHGDQWKWGVRKEGEKVVYVPVPTDRDQAFSTKDGLLLGLTIRVAGLKFIQKFDDKVDNVKALAQINRFIDRLVTNKLTLDDWQTIAKDVQSKLTDGAIEESIKGLPPEIFAIRGNSIISKLKSRRDHLVEYVTDYYGLLAEEAEVVGTKADEYFEINNIDGDNTEVKIYAMNDKGERETNPVYSRLFKESETDEVRVYGIDGNDTYKVSGKMSRKINLRIIGGPDRDTVIDESASNANRRIHIYDNADNSFPQKANTKLHLSEDSSVHVYDYNTFKADKKGLIPHLGYNDDDRIFVGAMYRFLNYRWRKIPFAYRQSIDVAYSITQGAFSATYNCVVPRLIGAWDLVGRANYDQVRWQNFHGFGNETPNITDDRDFYRMRSEDKSVRLGLNKIAPRSNIRFTGFWNRVVIIQDTARFVSKLISTLVPGVYTPDNFTGAEVTYDYANVRDTVLPDKGITFSLMARHTQNLDASDRSFQLYSGQVQFFIPIYKKLSIAIKTGASTVGGTPLFYQYPNIGQSYNLRGFRRERFSGKSVAYNNLELRFIGKKFRSYLFNGKLGLMAFMDNGRVWKPDEDSKKMHTTLGGGILLAPFYMTSMAITYGVSDELKMFQFRLGILF